MEMDDLSDRPRWLQDWTRTIKDSFAETSKDTPNYYLNSPQSLLSTSNIHSYQTGTGDDIFATIIPSLESAQQEIIFVTCFWAASPSLQKLSQTLLALSNRVLAEGRPRVRVRICLSSLSLFQKLFQTSSLAGRTYAPREGSKKLGLPSPEQLPGLNLTVKSIFVRPFSVMHPKFIILDRHTVFLPSCNVSWEEWFEGCVQLSGPIVSQFILFYHSFWKDANEPGPVLDVPSDLSRNIDETAIQVPRNSGISFHEDGKDVPSIFLPSPHHINPRFRPLPWQSPAPPPKTPLNTFLLQLFTNADKEIYIQTPNLTAPPVLTALLNALRRGVNVTILTSERLMILEQLVTAGTTTARCVKKLIKRHRALHNLSSRKRTAEYADVEGALRKEPGNLRVRFYQPRVKRGPGEPVQSHLKLTAIDGEWLVLGSGNMDRASWYTSQELGVAFQSREVVERVMGHLEKAIEGREKVVYEFC